MTWLLWVLRLRLHKGPQPLTSSREAVVHRQRQIVRYAQAMNERTADKLAELARFLDQWVIVPTSDGYAATPGWDLSLAIARPHYSCPDEAAAAVVNHGGVLRPSRHRAWMVA